MNIERGAVIGEGAIVTKDIPEFAVACGVPDEIIKYRRISIEGKLRDKIEVLNMKVLFISTDAYPHSGACASLLNKVLIDGNLHSKFEEVHVIAAKSAFDESVCENVDGITIYRYFPLVRATKKEILRMVRTTPFRAAAYLLPKSFSALKYRLFGKFVFLDRGLEKACYKMLKRHGAQFDVIVPVSGHYEACSAVVRYLKRHRGKMVPYLMDPCATNLRCVGNVRRKAVRFEKKLFETAEAIITTPIGHKEAVQMYPAYISKKVYAMEFPNISTKTVDANKVAEKYKCVFAGTIYALARNPRYTMELFRLIKEPQVQLHFVGPTKDVILRFVDRDKIGDNVTFHGMMPLERAREEIAGADFLVNIGNIMVNQVPSKIFEYISAGKPIINICVNENCPSLPYMSKYPLALSVVEGVGTVEENAEKIERFILENTGRSVDKVTILDLFKECTAEYCATRIFDILQNVVNTG